MRPRASEVLRTAGCSSLLITDPVHVLYLSGVRISDGAVTVDRSGYTLYVDGRYDEVARREAAKDTKVAPRKVLEKWMRKRRAIGYEDHHVTVAMQSYWKRKYPSIEFVQTTQILAQFRRSKSQAELQKFTKAKRITRRLLAQVPSMLRVGMTEQELAAAMYGAAMQLGADEWAFDPIVAFGTHTSRPHHHPSSKKLRARDIVQIDAGVRVQGYCSDQSRVFFVGEPTQKQQKVYDAVARAKKAAEKMVRAGTSVREIDAAARRSLQEDGLEEFFVHSTGHGVGLEIHEGPVLSIGAEDVALVQGEIVTVEPGVYIPGSFGIRLEDEWVAQ